MLQLRQYACSQQDLLSREQTIISKTDGLLSTSHIRLLNYSKYLIDFSNNHFSTGTPRSYLIFLVLARLPSFIFPAIRAANRQGYSEHVSGELVVGDEQAVKIYAYLFTYVGGQSSVHYSIFKQSLLQPITSSYIHLMVKTRSCEQEEGQQLRKLSPSQRAESQKALRKARVIHKEQLRRMAIKHIRSLQEKNRSSGTLFEETILDESWKEKLQCPVCLELMIMPTLTPCGHSFCLSCLQNSLKEHQRCCVCRETVTFDRLQQSKMVEKIVQCVKEQFSSAEQLQVYKKRYQEQVEWLEKRAPNKHMLVGDKLDFYHEGRWRQGYVTRLRPKLGVKTQEIQNREFFYELDSMLLAPHRYFSAPIERRGPVTVITGIRIQVSDLRELLFLNELISFENLITIERRQNQNLQGEVRFTFQRPEPSDPEEDEENEEEDQADS